MSSLFFMGGLTASIFPLIYREGRSQNRERPKKYITEDRKHNYPSIKVVLTEKLFLDKKHHNESALEQKLLWGKINILYARC